MHSCVAATDLDLVDCSIFITFSLAPPGALTGKALTYINRQYFSDANGNRGGAPNVAVVLVDGWPTDKVEEASRLARESGINIFFVTIEGPDESEKANLVETNFVDKVEYHHNNVLVHPSEQFKTHLGPMCRGLVLAAAAPISSLTCSHLLCVIPRLSHPVSCHISSCLVNKTS